MFNLLLRYLCELGDGALEVYRFIYDFFVKVLGNRLHFGHHLLLREVQCLLVLKVYIDIWVLAAIDLAIFCSVWRSSTANLQLHLVLFFQLVTSLLGG